MVFRIDLGLDLSSALANRAGCVSLDLTQSIVVIYDLWLGIFCPELRGICKELNDGRDNGANVL